jgi:hypothetical protein
MTVPAVMSQAIAAIPPSTLPVLVIFLMLIFRLVSKGEYMYSERPTLTFRRLVGSGPIASGDWTIVCPDSVLPLPWKFRWDICGAGSKRTGLAEVVGSKLALL